MFTPKQRSREHQPVSEVQPTHLSTCAETLASALERDPMTSYLFSSGLGRQARLRFVFRSELRYALRHGVVETIGDGRAVAIWLSPGEAQPESRLGDLLKSWPASTFFRLGLRAMWRGIRLLKTLHELRSVLAPREHWYLLGLGVHPEDQGKGWGSALLSSGIARARREGRPCYLETTNRENIAFYQRNGFRPIGCTPVAEGAVTVWALLHAAAIA